MIVLTFLLFSAIVFSISFQIKMKNLKKVLPEAEMKLKLAIDFIEKKQKDKNENGEDYLQKR